MKDIIKIKDIFRRISQLKKCFYSPTLGGLYYSCEHEIEIIFDENMNLDEKATIKRFKAELKNIKDMYELNPSKKEK